MNTVRKTLLLLAGLLAVTAMSARKLTAKDIKLTIAASKAKYRFRVTFVENHYDTTVTIRFNNLHDRGESYLRLEKGEHKKCDVTCTKVAAFPHNAKGEVVIKEVVVPQKQATTVPAKPVTPPAKDPKQPASAPAVDNDSTRILQVMANFRQYLDDVPFYSAQKMSDDSAAIAEKIENLKNWKEDALDDYRAKLGDYIQAQHDSLLAYEQQDSALVAAFLKKGIGVWLTAQGRKDCEDSLTSVLTRCRQRRAHVLLQLDEALASKPVEERRSLPTANIDWRMVANVGVVLVVLLVLVLWYRKTSKKQEQPGVRKTTPATSLSAVSAGTAKSTIALVDDTDTFKPVVLRRQSLDDVVDSPTYLKIDCSEFCDESAVRTIYLKNSCIKEIYNMYAEDLRNPANPKEDGCMVLGRWVRDEAAGQYDVSLEYVVLPGDDAVFSEYELNFGGKINMRKSRQLSRLRRETGLQYDLTCWVHSHPGLGVFFSNSDNNVHLQLRPPVHPAVLTAMVIDILTPTQELGIFTFRSDQTVNSKQDLKKTYSLEEMYQWAVQSERNTFRADDYYDVLAGAEVHAEGCKAVYLGNGAVIDMARLAAEQTGSFVAMVHGFSRGLGQATIHVAETVTRDATVEGQDPVGCFVVAPHCSIPSVRKAVARHLGKIGFVLVYTPVDGLLTAIPVVGGDLQAEENNYGEQTLEDLKIWTRRRR